MVHLCLRCVAYLLRCSPLHLVASWKVSPVSRSPSASARPLSFASLYWTLEQLSKFVASRKRAFGDLVRLRGYARVRRVELVVYLDIVFGGFHGFTLTIGFLNSFVYLGEDIPL